MTASRRTGFLAGLGAGALAVLTMFLLWLALDSPSLAELLADRLTFVVPLPLFDALLALLGSVAKRLLFASVVGGLVGLGGLAGAMAARRHLGLRDGLLWLAGLWAATAWLGLATLGAGPFGSATRQGAVGATLTLAMLFAVYGAAFSGLTRLVRPLPSGPEADPRRRRLLRLAGIGGVFALAAGVGVWEIVAGLSRGATQALSAAVPRGLSRMPAEVTPVGTFYTVSKNFFADPTVDVEGWRLEIGGQVDHPFALGYDELRALPAVEDYRTLMCISNEVGGDLIGNAQWRGVRLRDLLARAGPSAAAFKVVFTCADDYRDSIRFEKAMQPETIVVYEMNGEPLTPKHGYPARLLVPGIYGMKNVKWVRRIEVLDHDFKGFWQQRGWSDDAIVKTMSRIDTLAALTTTNLEPLLIGGVAFAGDRGIALVEYSVDGGQSWQPARLKQPLGPLTWVLWTAEWTPPAPGEYTVKVRATDGTGVTQSAIAADPLPDGAAGLHTVSVRALAS
ncbi:MAG TPA: molybdopterin-dependent oxidoreductase [Chloroflexota bacterium]|nr:molybdopterin-dependent oxidoreductase [Chloroflexota bacterium]